MGGKAIHESVGIPQDLVPTLFERVKTLLADIGINEVRLIGSAGKKPPTELSGDMDVLIRSWSTDESQNTNDLFEWLKCELMLRRDEVSSVNFLKGLGVLSFGLKHDGKVYQVDIMQSKNLDLAEWMMFTDPESKYKSGVRNSIIYWTLSERYYEPLDYDENGKVVRWKRLIFDHNRGIVELIQQVRGKGKETVRRRVLDEYDTPMSIIRKTFGSMPETVDNAEEAARWLRVLKEYSVMSGCNDRISSAKYYRIIDKVTEDCNNKGYKIDNEIWK